MRRRAILAAFFFFVLFSARAQMALSRCDHDWVIRYGTNSYGLQQTTSLLNPSNPNTFTTLYFGNYWHSFNATIWPVAAVFLFLVVSLLWLAIYGIGLKARAKRPRPDPAPPP